jgi:anti-anti-sigma factor
MNTQTLRPRRKPKGKLAFHVERGPHWLTVALRGEASFDQAEVISAQLLRISLDAYSLVVFDLGELTFLSSLAMGALVAYRRGLCRRSVEVRLANVQAQVWLALESAGLGTLFQPMELEQQPRSPAMTVAQPHPSRARTESASEPCTQRSGVSGVSGRSESSSGVSG